MYYFWLAWLIVAHAVSDVARLYEIDAWLNASAPGNRADAPGNRAGPPRHWAVRASGYVLGLEPAVGHGNQKSVRPARLPGGAPVVVKSVARGGRREEIALLELWYLEYLRGAPGVPLLHGGWATAEEIAWVTAHGGRSLSFSRSFAPHKKPLLEAYDERARDAPLSLARAWLRLFRSVAETGGFFLTDFKPEQFTLDARGDLYLVDGPAPNTGPVADLARRRLAPDGSPGGAPDVAPGAPRPCPADSDASYACAARTHPVHSGCHHGDCRNLSMVTCAPEVVSCLRRWCAPFGAAAHAYDVATRPWILPRIIELARDRGVAERLRRLAAKMTASDPGMRPTFDALLRELG